jgi:hypothetical protein
MDRRTQICLWIIVLGLLNFAAYTVGYWCIGGDAMNGRVYADPDRGDAPRHFMSRGGVRKEVDRGLWVYSALHSTSVWPSMGAVLLSMLTLAKDRITSAMRSTIVRGRTMMTLLAGLIVVISVAMTAYFIVFTVSQLTAPAPLPASLNETLP